MASYLDQWFLPTFWSHFGGDGPLVFLLQQRASVVNGFPSTGKEGRETGDMHDLIVC